MSTRSVKSYAKINISLRIVSKREDGYHELDSVMVPIELHDSIIISTLKNSGDNFVTVDDFSNGLVHYNLATEGINALAKRYGFSTKFRVYIHKVIPMQAGLGGGSSNAAFTMKAVNQMLKLNASDEELIDMAKTFGADIPFFVKCAPARCHGIGDIMEPIEIKNNYSVLIVKPASGCSTKEVFAIADKKDYNYVDIDNVVKALKEGDDDLLAPSIGNSLEEAASTLVPEIKQIKETLKAAGFKPLPAKSGASSFSVISLPFTVAKTVAFRLTATAKLSAEKTIFFII